MADRRFVTDSPQEADGYFAPLEQAGCLMLTTFERDGTAVSAPVRGAVDGDRAYFWAWSGSGSARRLRSTGAVQVTPSGARGFFTYGPPLDATARLLPAVEARQATGKLAHQHPVHRFLIPLFRRAWRQQILVYELADDAPGGQGQWPEGLQGPDRRGGQQGRHAVHDSREVVRVHCVQTRVTDLGISSIACIWPA